MKRERAEQREGRYIVRRGEIFQHHSGNGRRTHQPVRFRHGAFRRATSGIQIDRNPRRQVLAKLKTSCFGVSFAFIERVGALTAPRNMFQSSQVLQ